MQSYNRLNSYIKWFIPTCFNFHTTITFYFKSSPNILLHATKCLKAKYTKYMNRALEIKLNCGMEIKAYRNKPFNVRIQTIV